MHNIAKLLSEGGQQQKEVQTPCTDCGFCVLISNDCLCAFSPLQAVQLSELKPAIIVANMHVADCIGQQCMDRLCEVYGSEQTEENENWHAVLNSPLFKTWYARLIYKQYLADNGLGIVGNGGFKANTGTEFAESSNWKSSVAGLKYQQQANDAVIEKAEKQVMEMMKKLLPECFECKQEKLCCGCIKICQCEKEKNEKYSDWAAI